VENKTILQELFNRKNKIDSGNVFDILVNFHKQIKEAIEIGEQISFDDLTLENVSKTKNIAILGMGGSAIGGDLIKSYLEARKFAGQITIVRNYELPSYIDDSYLILAVSYSGNTEETLCSVKLALEITKNIICISTGGELLDIARSNNLNHILMPGGYQPRLALGYSIFVQLYTLIKLNLLTSVKDDKNFEQSIFTEIKELIQLIEANAEYYSMENEANAPYQIAMSLYKKQIMIYSSDNLLNTINYRWRGQFQENSKNLAYGGFLPEMNHNEINSFKFPEVVVENLSFLFLVDKEYHQRVLKRFEVFEDILKEANYNILVIQSHADGLLARMFDLIYLGDWISFYLAMLNNIDPTPIPLINKLKSELSK